MTNKQNKRRLLLVTICYMIACLGIIISFFWFAMMMAWWHGQKIWITGHIEWYAIHLTLYTTILIFFFWLFIDNIKTTFFALLCFLCSIYFWYTIIEVFVQKGQDYWIRYLPLLFFAWAFFWLFCKIYYISTRKKLPDDL